MKEIDLNRVYVPSTHAPEDYAPGEEMLVVAQNIIDRFNSGEKLYFQFKNGDRKGSIAFLKKIEENYRITKRTRSTFRGPQPEYSIHIKGTVGWDDRKNTAKVDLFASHVKFTFLDGYEEKSVWIKEDVKAEAEEIKKSTKVLDMRGKEINEGDIVVFINSRYGSGSCLDYGVVRDIIVKVRHNNYRNKKEVDIITVIENTRVSNIGTPIFSKIKNPKDYILVVTGTDLADDALMSKLES